MDICGEIKAIKYKPLLCRPLNEISWNDFEKSFSTYTRFLLKIDATNKYAISWWVSPKRTRSYPYARVYDTLQLSGKKITIIPIYKDEGIGGDRDYLQWDTISLMSLFGVHVIVSYYVSAKRHPKRTDKITVQKFDLKYIKEQILGISDFQSDALHWNMKQIENIGIVADMAFKSYELISRATGVEMHSTLSAIKRIDDLNKGKDIFLSLSRSLSNKAQKRESVTHQPKELTKGQKSKITIKNYLGGLYYFTTDECVVSDNIIKLIECKHSKQSQIPSIDDIKDGLIKMMLFVNLENVQINKSRFDSMGMLKLTSDKCKRISALSPKNHRIIDLLKDESIANKFGLMFNNKFI